MQTNLSQSPLISQSHFISYLKSKNISIQISPSQKMILIEGKKQQIIGLFPLWEELIPVENLLPSILRCNYFLNASLSIDDIIQYSSLEKLIEN
jgi:hypothetical protein